MFPRIFSQDGATRFSRSGAVVYPLFRMQASTNSISIVDRFVWSRC
jgi:hypothetical protein